jgi:hypothetical protein
MFIHHSVGPLLLNDLHDEDQSPLTDCGAKPNGLWFSVGNGADWRAAVMERFNPEYITCQTEVVLSQAANICRLNGAQHIDGFTAEYGKLYKARLQVIDWTRVASQFDGIIIAPHCNERCEDKTWWYKCWEVSCGCVWTPSAVKCLRPLNY